MHGLPRRALAEHCANEDAQIEAGDMHQIAFVDVLTSAQPSAAHAAAVEDVGEETRPEHLRRKPNPAKVSRKIPIPPERVVNITLEEAIEIHAKALCYRHGTQACEKARDRARQLSRAGDDEGYHVWLKVAAVAETVLGAKAKKMSSGFTS